MIHQLDRKHISALVFLGMHGKTDSLLLLNKGLLGRTLDFVDFGFVIQEKIKEKDKLKGENKSLYSYIINQEGLDFLEEFHCYARSSERDMFTKTVKYIIDHPKRKAFQTSDEVPDFSGKEVELRYSLSYPLF